MPSESRAQQHLMQAAEHGAKFPMAEKVRGSMTHEQMHDFSVGKEEGKPEHVREHHGTPHEQRAELHGHAARHGHGGMHAEAYVNGALGHRHGMHQGNHPRMVASGHGYSGSHVDAYLEGAENEANGEHAMNAEPDEGGSEVEEA